MSNTGYIAKYVSSRGFGFIRSAHRNQDLFFHVRELQACDPERDVFVTFEVVPGRERGQWKATGVCTTHGTTEQRRAWALDRAVVDRRPDGEHRLALQRAITTFEEAVRENHTDGDEARQARQRIIDHSHGGVEVVTLCHECASRASAQPPPRAAAALAATHTAAVKKHAPAPHKATRKPKTRPARSAVRAGPVEHRIQQLTPHPRWWLLIDETGSRFEGQHQSGTKGVQGRFVGVLLPFPIHLSGLPDGTHYTSASPAKRDRILQALLAAEAGIFGVTVDDLPQQRGQQWVAGVVHVIDWVLRLLPLDGQTQVSIRVEQRGEHGPQSNWNALLESRKYQLALEFPERAREIDANIKLVEKDGNAWQAYADAVAHTWCAASPDAAARLRKSKLLDTCLHAGTGSTLQRAWTTLARGSSLDGQTWRTLIHDPDAGRPLGLARTLLDQLAQACRDDPKLWVRYLGATRDHLEGKAVELAQLKWEVAWLASCQPADASFEPALDLAWKTVQLESRNHEGHIDLALEERLEELSSLLREERPTLVCQADLDRAVLMTNRFDFPAARRILSSWSAMDVRIPRLQHWARVQSSLGQHAAFEGRWEDAERHFEEALSAFDRLTDGPLAAREKAQTSTYRAIAALEGAEPARARGLVEVVAPLDPDSIREMAQSDAAVSKYSHHLLVRYLAELGTPEERAHYLECREHWGEGEGHPWPLIQAYRAILLRADDPERALDSMIEGFRMATRSEAGPTVRLIGLTLGVAAMAWGSAPLLTTDELEEQEARLPCASPNIRALRAAFAQLALEPLGLLAQVLPFNFR